MEIYADVQRLDIGDQVDLYEIDLTELGGERLLFHKYMQVGNIVFDGQEYTAWPITVEGIEQRSEGVQPRPILTVSNVGSDVNGDPIPGLVSALCIQFQDMVGAPVVVRRTLGKYLDAVNFPDGNPDADPTQQFPPQRWRIEARRSSDDEVVSFELGSVLDTDGQKIPDLVVMVSVCAWLRKGGYRGPYCGYIGAAMFDEDDNPTTDPAKDRCAGRLSSCRLRQAGFPDQCINILAAPAADRLRA